LTPRREPYWKTIFTGLSIGLYRGKESSSWCARRKREDGEDGSSRWKSTRLGLVDDHADADGKQILTFAQAVRQAQQWAEKATEDDTDEPDKTASGDYTVQSAVADYLAGKQANGSDTYTQELNFKNHVLPKFCKRPLSGLRAYQLNHWRNGLTKGRTRSTANRIISDFKAALNKAYDDNRVTDNKGWRNLKKFSNADNPRTDYLQAKEAKRLINSCDPEFRPMVQAALFTGGRYAEIAATQVRDFNAKSKTLRFKVTKNRKIRAAYLSTEAVGHFKLWCAGKQSRDLIFTHTDGSPWLKSQQFRRMRAACEAARIDPPVGFHALRHTYGSLLALEGVPIKFIAEALGHRDSRMTEKHYAHLQTDAVADEIRKNLPSYGKANSKVATL
jgi:integrase